MANFPKYNPSILTKFSPNPSLPKTISLDTGYLPLLNSNRAIGEFDLELRQAFGVLYDYYYNQYQPNTFLSRALLYGLFNFLTWGPCMTQMALYHELGHATRFRSIGIDTSFVNVGKAAWRVYTKGEDKLALQDILSDGYFPTLGGAVLSSALLPTVFSLSAVMPRYDRNVLFTPWNPSNYYDPHSLRLLQELMNSRLQEEYNPKKDKDLILVKNVAVTALSENLFVPDVEVLIFAGGLNAQQDQVRRVEDHLWYSNRDHFSVVGTYFWDKTWAGVQSILSMDQEYSDNQDTSRICRAYRKMGVSLTHEDIIGYSYLSYLLSAQTYANIYQIYKTLMTGHNYVFAPEYWNIKLPNIGLYFTTQGPTYNISSGYRVGQTLFIPVSMEIGLKHPGWEANIGVRKMIPSFHKSFVHLEVVFNTRAIGGSIYGGLLLDRTWNIQAGLIYHNSKTFQGERNIPSYKGGDTDIEVWLKLGIQY